MVSDWNEGSGTERVCQARPLSRGMVCLSFCYCRVFKYTLEISQYYPHCNLKFLLPLKKWELEQSVNLEAFPFKNQLRLFAGFLTRLSIKLAPGRRLKHLTLSLVHRKLREVHGRSLLHGQTTSLVKVILVYIIYVCFAIKKTKQNKTKQKHQGKLLRCFSLLYFPGTQSGLKFCGKNKIRVFKERYIRLLIFLFDVFRRYNYSLVRNFVELR